MAIPRRKWIKPVALGVGVLLVLSVGALALLYAFAFSMEDGPFHGRAAECPTTAPVQEFPIRNSLTLRVYEPSDEALSPIVTLSSPSRTLWCIYADAYPETRVARIEFRRSTHWPLLRQRVVGSVEWTYGHEATWWYIEDDGAEYWYSW